METLWQRIVREGVRKAVESLTDEEAVRLTEQFGTHNYHPLPVNIVRAKGPFAYDGAGKEYIDCIGGYSAVAHGHLGDFLLSTLQDQLDKLALTSRAMYTSELALFSKALAEYAELDMVCPMNTGVEAIETCIKLARKWAYTVKGVPEGQAEIVVFEGNFHGRTTTVVGFSSEPGYRAGFGPFTPGFRLVPFGDLGALEAAMGPNTAAVLGEPIQCEAGILIPPDGFLSGCRALCDRFGALLVWDEVQTGFCRTGERFAWMHERARPDMVAVGKPLGGGILPVSAAIGRREVMDVFRPGDHGSTFGGNPISCAVGLAAMAEMETQHYAERSRKGGERLQRGLLGLGHPDVLEVRGRGMLVGLEVREEVDTARLGERLLASGLLTKETRHRTFRFAPPIVTEDAVLDEIVRRVGRSLAG